MADDDHTAPTTPEPTPEPLPENSATGSAVTPGSSASADSLPPAAPVILPDSGYTPSGVPTLEGVREKIETRFGTALGATELAEDTPEARSAADRYEARQKAAADKLEEIRASMHKSE